MATLDNNNVGGGAFDVSVAVEQDDGVFLAVTVRDEETFDDVLDMVTTNPREIEQFFDDVARAKADWERLRVTT